MSQPGEARAKSTSLAPALKALAEQEGLLTEYVDSRGRTRRASRDAVLRMLRALSIDARSEREAALVLREKRKERAARGAPHVCVAWAGHLDALRLQAAESQQGAWKIRIHCEDGKVLVREGHLADALTITRARAPLSPERVLPLGIHLPLGYHRLELSVGQRTTETLVIAAPRKAPEPSGRTYGVFAPVHALRGSTRQGSGTLTDLGELCELVQRQGGTFVGTLPMMAQFLDNPYDTSPFAPASRLFWNELFLDIRTLPGLSDCAEARALVESSAFVRELSRLDAAPFVQARHKIKLVHALLEPLARSFFAGGGDRDESFAAFVAEHPYAREYARFRALVEAHGEPTRWPVSVSQGTHEGAPDRQAMHLFAQWQMHTQLSRVREQASARGVSLYTDLPVGVHRTSFDMFREPECFIGGANAGAPPDALCPTGQDWGFAPMHPEGQRRQHYRYLRAYLRSQLEHAGMLRIDHVMGLSRLFCVPHGMGAEHGIYVRQPEDELYAIVALEAMQSGSVVVGEDLGTVPEQVRTTMRTRGIQRMFVLPFELDIDDDGTGEAREPSTDALATLNTHDMPTFAAAFHAADIDERESRGVISGAEAQVEREERMVEQSALTSALGLAAGASCEELLNAAIRHLGESSAQLVQVALEDLWGELRPQNVPGTFDPDRNFCRRMAFGLSSQSALPRVLSLLAALREARHSTPEAPRVRPS